MPIHRVFHMGLIRVIGQQPQRLGDQLGKWPMVGVQPLVNHSLRQAGFAQALKVAFEIFWILEIRQALAKLRDSQMGL